MDTGKTVFAIGLFTLALIEFNSGTPVLGGIYALGSAFIFVLATENPETNPSA